MVSCPESERCRARRAAAAGWILGAAVAILTLVAPSVADAAAPGFERSVYGTATLTESGASTLIRVTDGSGGLRLRAVLDPTRTYRMAIDGRPAGGDALNMRLSFDGRLDYRSAPQAREFVRISGTTTFEVLLYSDRPAGYEFAAAVLEECSGACGTQADLKALVLEQTPGLATALAAGDHNAAADLILQWAAARIPMGSVLLNTQQLSAAEIYFDYFRPLERGVYCGGAADFLHKLLDLFAIPSFTVDFGTTVDALTHVTVVLVDDRPGAVRWRVVDPTFAMTFGMPVAARPLSLEQILEADRVGLSEQIVPALGDLSDRAVVLIRGAGEDPERLRCRDSTRFSVCGLTSYGRSFDALFARNGFTPGLAGIFELFRRGELYHVDAPRVPADFVAMQAQFRSAASRNDTTTVLAELPLRPVLRRPALVAGGSVVGDELALSQPDWHPRAGADIASVAWERCAADGADCKDTGAAGSTYRLSDADIGRRLRAVITAANAYGQSLAPSSLGELVTAPPPPARAAVAVASGARAVDARLPPRGLSARTTRARADAGGLRYTTTGRLTPPRGLTRKAACRRAAISVSVTRGRALLSQRTVRLRSDCTYRSAVVVRERRRRGRLRIVARFLGSELLRPRAAVSRLETRASS